jgi:hypothetical protein
LATRAGLGGLDGRVGEQLDAGPQDAGDLAVDDDRAVHLRELAQAGRGELDVEDEPARAHGLDRVVVAQDDECAGAPAQDPFETVAQRLAGRDRG